MKIEERYLPFGPLTTYVRIVGEDHGLAPLVLLHGGPGSSHNYFELLDPLAAATKRQLIMYDQVGCGQSSLVDDLPAVYTAQTWLAELANLRAQLHLAKIHLLGQSWGGMLALLHLLQPTTTGVQSVILSSTLASARLWGQAVHGLISQLPPAQQAAIAQAEASGDYTSPAYQEALTAFMAVHALEPVHAAMPAPLQRPKCGGQVAYQTAWGPNEFTPTGNLRDYDVTARLSQLNLPALVINGDHDLCTDAVAQQLVTGLPQARWEKFSAARHMVFYDQPARYQACLVDWLAGRP